MAAEAASLQEAAARDVESLTTSLYLDLRPFMDQAPPSVRWPCLPPPQLSLQAPSCMRVFGAGALSQAGCQASLTRNRQPEASVDVSSLSTLHKRSCTKITTILIADPLYPLGCGLPCFPCGRVTHQSWQQCLASGRWTAGSNADTRRALAGQRPLESERTAYSSAWACGTCRWWTRPAGCGASSPARTSTTPPALGLGGATRSGPALTLALQSKICRPLVAVLQKRAWSGYTYLV